MNKQLIQDIINAGNKAMNTVPVKYTVDTRDTFIIVMMDFIMMIIM